MRSGRTSHSVILEAVERHVDHDEQRVYGNIGARYLHAMAISVYGVAMMPAVYRTSFDPDLRSMR